MLQMLKLHIGFVMVTSVIFFSATVALVWAVWLGEWRAAFGMACLSFIAAMLRHQGGKTLSAATKRVNEELQKEEQER